MRLSLIKSDANSQIISFVVGLVMISVPKS
jgi:hypothetical protein